MTIERIHFDGGYPLDLKKGIHPQIIAAALSHKDESEKLPEGDYRLTPEWWTRHAYEHTLTVLDTGRGIYRAIPTVEGVVWDNRGKERRRNGQTISLPRDQVIVAVNGPRPDRETFGIYEVIVYTPGPNPMK